MVTCLSLRESSPVILNWNITSSLTGSTSLIILTRPIPVLVMVQSALSPGAKFSVGGSRIPVPSTPCPATGQFSPVIDTNLYCGLLISSSMRSVLESTFFVSPLLNEITVGTGSVSVIPKSLTPKRLAPILLMSILVSLTVACLSVFVISQSADSPSVSMIEFPGSACPSLPSASVVTQLNWLSV